MSAWTPREVQDHVSFAATVHPADRQHHGGTIAHRPSNGPSLPGQQMYSGTVLPVNKKRGEWLVANPPPDTCLPNSTSNPFLASTSLRTSKSMGASAAGGTSNPFISSSSRINPFKTSKSESPTKATVNGLSPEIEISTAVAGQLAAHENVTLIGKETTDESGQDDNSLPSDMVPDEPSSKKKFCVCQIL